MAQTDPGVANSCHLPPHYQFYCVGKDTIQNQGKAGSWKAKKLTVSGICLGGTAWSLVKTAVMTFLRQRNRQAPTRWSIKVILAPSD